MSESGVGAPNANRRVRRPRMSGFWTVLVLVLCFVVTAVLVPRVLRLPGWVEAEVILACWWVIWGVALSMFLYRHALVEEDYPQGGSGGEMSQQYLLWTTRDSGDSSVTGCIVGFLVYLLLIVLIWVLVELVVPLLMVTVYFVVWGMLASVLNTRHRCRGRLWRAAGWGWLWATVYTAPLALVVWVVHLATRN